MGRSIGQEMMTIGHWEKWQRIKRTWAIADCQQTGHTAYDRNINISSYFIKLSSTLWKQTSAKKNTFPVSLHFQRIPFAPFFLINQSIFSCSIVFSPFPCSSLRLYSVAFPPAMKKSWTWACKKQKKRFYQKIGPINCKIREIAFSYFQKRYSDLN